MQVDHVMTINRDTPSLPARPTILHVAHTLDGGVPRCVNALVSDQVERGWDVVVACPAESDVAIHARKLGVEHDCWIATRGPGRGVPREISRLVHIIDNRRPVLVHLHSSKAGLAGRIAIHGRRATIFHPHGWSFDAVDGLAGLGSTIWERFATRWADAVVCVSESERRRGEAQGLKVRWSVIANGIDLSEFRVATEHDRDAARALLSIPADPLVVCVGRLCDAKGQDVLLSAWPRVLERVPSARLVLVGDGPDRESLERMARPRVDFVGFQSDVRDWLAAADVVAVPSRREGMAYAMLEAVARSRSVVSSDVPGACEVIADDAGAIVPIENPDLLAASLAERLENPALAAAEGAAGRHRVEISFNVQLTVKAAADLYSDVLSARAAATHV